jgi:hypothetical protein
VDPQVAVPGTQSHIAQRPEVQLCPEAQACVDSLSPSCAQMATLLASRHRVAPGVHTRARQAPLSQRSLLPHITSVVPRPSVLQTRRALDDAQTALPGTHTRGTQRPSRHDSPVAQPSPREVSPSLLHTARVVTPVQVASPGLQVQSTQRPAEHD